MTRDAIVQLAVATLIPLAPLLLTMMPLEELLRKHVRDPLLRAPHE